MLDISANNWWVLVTALGAGAVGGLAAALILLDPTETQGGLPAGTNPWKVVGIRTLVGAVAATAFLFFFPVQQKTVVGVAGHLTTTTTYPFITVIALGLVVGSGGSAFLSAMRDKANSMITATQAQGKTATMKQTAIAGMRPLVTMASSITHVGATNIAHSSSDIAGHQLHRVADQLPPEFFEPSGLPSELVRGIMANAGRSFQEADPLLAHQVVTEAVAPMPEQLASDVQSALEDQVNQVIDQLNEIG
jgi:hypothetical protein